MPGLYVHIPFCVRKCDYCAFYSVVSNGWKKQALFFQALEEEVRDLPAGFLPETIFIGGGTPTAPDLQTLEKMVPMFGRFSPSEFSVEVNPGTVDADKLALLRRCGVNRLSIGVQSFDAGLLEALGRIQSAAEAEAAFRQARTAGFGNISIDLMFGIPGQTMAMLDADLDCALALGPEHISIYNLMVEEGTPLAGRTLLRPEEELEREMYDHLRSRLRAAGFVHYEISNFAKPGFECRHNLLYWTGGEYIGCGPAAHSHWRGTRWANVSDLDEYCASGPRREFEETLPTDAKERETLVMGLRLLRGVEVSSALWKNLAEVIGRLENVGLLVVDGRHIRLSEEALFVSDFVFAELV